MFNKAQLIKILFVFSFVALLNDVNSQIHISTDDKGRLDLCNKDSVQSQQVCIWNKKIKRLEGFTNTTFLKGIVFDSSTFLSVAKFDSSIFLDANFSNANFSCYAYFLNVKYKGNGNFQHTNFDSVCFLSGGSFDSIANFLATNFNNHAYFRNITFKWNANFNWSIFSDYTDFSIANFLKETNFNEAHFLKFISFESATFRKKCYFSKLTFSDSTQLIFKNTIFPDTIDFSNNDKIYNEIDFTKANFKDSSRYDYFKNKIIPIYMNLYRTDISKLRLDYIHFKLKLIDTVSNDDNESMYEYLLANFKAHGQLESYRLCDIEYKTFKDNKEGHYFFSWLQKWWWNWGYNPEFVFHWALILFLILHLFTFTFIYYFNNIVYTIPFVSVNSNWRKVFSGKDFNNRVVQSLIYSVSIFLKFSFVVQNIHTKRWEGNFWIKLFYFLSFLFLILMYFLGIFCIAYMANFVFQKL